jgi:uncharacterized membrane protein
VTTQSGVQVSLSFSDWLRLIGLVFVLAATIVGVFWRQNELIRDVATEQVLLKQRVERLEQR